METDPANEMPVTLVLRPVLMASLKKGDRNEGNNATPVIAQSGLEAFAPHFVTLTIRTPALVYVRSNKRGAWIEDERRATC